MPASQQEWSDYIQEYEANLPALTVNNRVDYTRQYLYLAWLKSTYAKYENDWENMPDDITFSSYGTSGTYTSILDSQLHAVIVQAFGASGSMCMISDEFTVTITYDIDPQTQYAQLPEFAQGATYIYQPDNAYIMPTVCKTYGQRFSSHHVVTGTYFPARNYFWNSSFSPSTFQYWRICVYMDNRQVTLGQNYIGSYGLYPADTSSYVASNGVRVDEINTTIDTNNPWDHYNEDLLPDIDPDNAAFPEGYHPSTPHDPPEEPVMDVSDEGDVPEYDPTTIVTAPSLFITQYVLSQSLLQSLGETLWQSWLTPNTDIWENFLWDFASQTGTFNITAALDYIISLRVYPFDLNAIINPIPPTGFYGHSDGVYMGTGKTNFTYSSGATNIITINSVNGYMDLGECTVVSPDAPFNDFRDMFNSSISCYLPFCGTIELNPVDVYGRKLRCSYFIDFQSGGCTALVECKGDVGWFPVGCKSGQMGFTLPLTATNAGQLAATFASDAVQAVGTLSGLYFNVGRSAANVASAIATKNVESTNTAMTAMNLGQSTVDTGLSLANQALGILSRSGVDMPLLSGGTGCEALAMYRRPFITIRRGKYAKPENFPHSVAYKNGTSSTISDYHGMTQFTGVDTTGLTCHDDEKEAIISLLQSGVYLP